MFFKNTQRIFDVYFLWCLRVMCVSGIISLVLVFCNWLEAGSFVTLYFFNAASVLMLFGFLAEMLYEASKQRDEGKDNGWDNDNGWTPPDDDPPPSSPSRLSRQRPHRAVAHGRRVRERISLPLQE